MSLPIEYQKPSGYVKPDTQLQGGGYSKPGGYSKINDMNQSEAYQEGLYQAERNKAAEEIIDLKERSIQLIQEQIQSNSSKIQAIRDKSAGSRISDSDSDNIYFYQRANVGLTREINSINKEISNINKTGFDYIEKQGVGKIYETAQDVGILNSKIIREERSELRDRRDAREAEKAAAGPTKYVTYVDKDGKTKMVTEGSYQQAVSQGKVGSVTKVETFTPTNKTGSGTIKQVDYSFGTTTDEEGKQVTDPSKIILNNNLSQPSSSGSTIGAETVKLLLEEQVKQGLISGREAALKYEEAKQSEEFLTGSNQIKMEYVANPLSQSYSDIASKTGSINQRLNAEVYQLNKEGYISINPFATESQKELGMKLGITEESISEANKALERYLDEKENKKGLTDYLIKGEIDYDDDLGLMLKGTSKSLGEALNYKTEEGEIIPIYDINVSRGYTITSDPTKLKINESGIIEGLNEVTSSPDISFSNINEKYITEKIKTINYDEPREPTPQEKEKFKQQFKSEVEKEYQSFYKESIPFNKIPSEFVGSYMYKATQIVSNKYVSSDLLKTDFKQDYNKLISKNKNYVSGEVQAGDKVIPIKSSYYTIEEEKYGFNTGITSEEMLNQLDFKISSESLYPVTKLVKTDKGYEKQEQMIPINQSFIMNKKYSFDDVIKSPGMQKVLVDNVNKEFEKKSAKIQSEYQYPIDTWTEDATKNLIEKQDKLDKMIAPAITPIFDVVGIKYDVSPRKESNKVLTDVSKWLDITEQGFIIEGQKAGHTAYKYAYDYWNYQVPDFIPFSSEMNIVKERTGRATGTIASNLIEMAYKLPTLPIMVYRGGIKYSASYIDAPTKLSQGKILELVPGGTEVQMLPHVYGSVTGDQQSQLNLLTLSKESVAIDLIEPAFVLSAFMGGYAGKAATQAGTKAATQATSQLTKSQFRYALEQNVIKATPYIMGGSVIGVSAGIETLSNVPGDTRTLDQKLIEGGAKGASILMFYKGIEKAGSFAAKSIEGNILSNKIIFRENINQMEYKNLIQKSPTYIVKENKIIQFEKQKLPITIYKPQLYSIKSSYLPKTNYIQAKQSFPFEVKSDLVINKFSIIKNKPKTKISILKNNNIIDFSNQKSISFKFKTQPEQFNLKIISIEKNPISEIKSSQIGISTSGALIEETKYKESILNKILGKKNNEKIIGTSIAYTTPGETSLTLYGKNKYEGLFAKQKYLKNNLVETKLYFRGNLIQESISSLKNSKLPSMDAFTDSNVIIANNLILKNSPIISKNLNSIKLKEISLNNKDFSFVETLNKNQLTNIPYKTKGFSITNIKKDIYSNLLNEYNTRNIESNFYVYTSFNPHARKIINFVESKTGNLGLLKQKIIQKNLNLFKTDYQKPFDVNEFILGKNEIKFYSITNNKIKSPILLNIEKTQTKSLYEFKRQNKFLLSNEPNIIDTKNIDIIITENELLKNIGFYEPKDLIKLDTYIEKDKLIQLNKNFVEPQQKIVKGISGNKEIGTYYPSTNTDETIILQTFKTNSRFNPLTKDLTQSSLTKNLNIIIPEKSLSLPSFNIKSINKELLINKGLIIGKELINNKELLFGKELLINKEIIFNKNYNLNLTYTGEIVSTKDKIKEIEKQELISKTIVKDKVILNEKSILLEKTDVLIIEKPITEVILPPKINPNYKIPFDFTEEIPYVYINAGIFLKEKEKKNKDKKRRSKQTPTKYAPSLMISLFGDLFKQKNAGKILKQTAFDPRTKPTYTNVKLQRQKSISKKIKKPIQPRIGGDERFSRILGF